MSGPFRALRRAAPRQTLQGMPAAPSHRSFLRRKLVDPVHGLLRRGVTPERLAWSLAVGFVIGVNPLLGSTTVLALAAAYALGLNLVASQIVNHLVYPLELLLFPVFVKLGSVLFHTTALPLSRKELFRSARGHPWATTRLLWSWEWHALIAWTAFAAVAAPALALALRPPLKKAQTGMKRRELRHAEERAAAQE